MADYILKNMGGKFWANVKKLAIDKKMTVKRLILSLLEIELKKNK